MLLDFPYTVHDEPAEHWTVEQVLHWYLLRAQAETEASYEQTVERLQQQFQAGIESTMDEHEQVKAILRQQQQQQHEGENADPQIEQPNAVDATKKLPAVDNSVQSGTIRVDIVAGKYAGNVYTLKPGSKPCFVGRSSSKKYTHNGISLTEDAEVSTSHGRFLRKNGGTFAYIDDGSTNGSYINGQMIERHEEVPLEMGMEIVVGATTMKITLAN